jgi:hypothetical protein
MKKNEWASRFGAARRATDRKLLAECERRIAAEEKQRAAEERIKMNDEIQDQLDAILESERRRRAIAQAFGRPVS